MGPYYVPGYFLLEFDARSYLLFDYLQSTINDVTTRIGTRKYLEKERQ